MILLPNCVCCGTPAFDCEEYFGAVRPEGKTGLPDVIYVGLRFWEDPQLSGYNSASIDWQVEQSGAFYPTWGEVDASLYNRAMTHLGGGLYEWVDSPTILNPCGLCPGRRLAFDCSTGLVTAEFPITFGWKGSDGGCVVGSLDFYDSASQTVSVQGPPPPTGYDSFTNPIAFAGDPLQVYMKVPTLGYINFLDALALGYNYDWVILDNCKHNQPINTPTAYEIAMSGPIAGTPTRVVSGSESFTVASGQPVLNNALWWRYFNPWWS